jgi:hypothetical protein
VQNPRTIKITGTGATVALAASSTPTRWVDVQAASGNTGTVRLGDSTTASATGREIAKGTSFLLPFTYPNQIYDLATIYVYVAAGDVVNVTYVPN